jgi:hypothetical protein
MLDIGTFHEMSWKEVVIPEILWLTLLIRQHGLRAATDLSLSLATAVMEFRDELPHLQFFKTSNYAHLTAIHQASILTRLREARQLVALQEALRPLLHHYPECPLGFLGGADDVADPSLESVRDTLGGLFDKTSREAMMPQALAIYIAMATGMLHIRKGQSLENLHLIEEYPTTDESQRLASGIRASINALVGGPSGAVDRTWSDYFWQTGWALQACEFGEP